MWGQNTTTANQREDAAVFFSVIPLFSSPYISNIFQQCREMSRVISFLFPCFIYFFRLLCCPRLSSHSDISQIPLSQTTLVCKSSQTSNWGLHSYICILSFYTTGKKNTSENFNTSLGSFCEIVVVVPWWVWEYGVSFDPKNTNYFRLVNLWWPWAGSQHKFVEQRVRGEGTTDMCAL